MEFAMDAMDGSLGSPVGFLRVCNGDPGALGRDPSDDIPLRCLNGVYSVFEVQYPNLWLATVSSSTTSNSLEALLLFASFPVNCSIPGTLF
jgi:hypothetical protein